MANHTATQTVPPALAVPATAPSVSLWTDALRRFRRHRLAVLGAAILTVMVIGVVAGPLVYRVPIDEIDFRAKLQGPSAAHPFGTDDLGQDLLARMMYGGRISLAVGVAAMLIAIVIGTTIGALSGYVGGMADHALMRVTDLFLALPQLPLLLLRVRWPVPPEAWSALPTPAPPEVQWQLGNAVLFANDPARAGSHAVRGRRNAVERDARR